jgi:hypothetical protein
MGHGQWRIHSTRNLWDLKVSHRPSAKGEEMIEPIWIFMFLLGVLVGFSLRDLIYERLQRGKK